MTTSDDTSASKARFPPLLDMSVIEQHAASTSILLSIFINILEEEVQQWIEGVLKEPFPEDLTFAEALRDGTRLCRLMNEIQVRRLKLLEVLLIPVFHFSSRTFSIADTPLMLCSLRCCQ